MSFAATAALVGAGTSVYMGAQQRKKANQIRDNASDPGINPNYSLDRVTETLFQDYSNFNLPGYSKMVGQIGSNQATANNLAVNASVSSADVLNSITNNQVAADNAIAELGIAEGNAKQQALMRYLDSLNNQGQDQLRMDAQKEQRFQAQLNEAAALEGASIQNINSGFQDALVSTSAMVGNFMPRQSINQSTGQVISLPSVWDQVYNKKKTGVVNPSNGIGFKNGVMA